MKIVKTISEIRKEIIFLKQSGKTIGFVPTMGALHKGHTSLIEKSVSENDVTIASIFVNPIQFNDKKDLENYPRNLKDDIKILKKTSCDILFAPDEKEMYPEPDKRIFDFGHFDKVMEGKFREGHFNGVAIVVSKLFDIIEPHKAYFGEKDFQQLTIIKQLVKKLNYQIEIVPCSIIREPDGLAMSSRNTRLSPEERKSAGQINKILVEAKKLAENFSIEEVKQFVIHQINSVPLLKTEYFEIVDSETLLTVKDWSEKKRLIGCIAVMAGKIRLIDNIYF